jgi:hypothetical protein
MSQSTELLRPCNVSPDKGLSFWEGMFYCLQCGASFPFLSWDGEMMWHNTPISDPHRKVEDRHTLFTGWRLDDAGEKVPL